MCIIRCSKCVWIVLLSLVWAGQSFSAAGEITPEDLMGVQLQITAEPKDDWVNVHVGGQVLKEDKVTPIQGARVTISFRSDDGVDEYVYYDYIYETDSYVLSGMDEGHCTTPADGSIRLLVDLRIDEIFWEANFNVCVSCPGYVDQCQTVNFDYEDDDDDRIFYLIPDVVPTATPTMTPTFSPSATPTATPTETLVLTPTNTATAVGEPTAVNPQLDVDNNGVIGPGDLILLMEDWLRPVR